MTTGTPITGQACEKCRNDIDNQLGRNERRLNSHSEDIQELSVISSRLLLLQELAEKRLAAVEEAIRKGPIRPPWYESDTGKWVIKAGTIILILLLTAAIGKGFLTEIQPVKDLLP